MSMLGIQKKFFRDHPIYLLLTWAVIALAVLGIIFFIMLLSKHQDWFNDCKQTLEPTIAYFVINLLIAILAIVVAYSKSDNALTRSKMNYLLKIDERWLSPEIIEARNVIHVLYLEVKRKSPGISHARCKQIIGNKIMDLRDNRKKSKEFIYLLNFLDFMETIGYLHQENAVSTVEINELMGNSIIYFYEIFEEYIKFRRKDRHDEAFYKMIEKLYHILSLKKISSNYD